MSGSAVYKKKVESALNASASKGQRTNTPRNFANLTISPSGKDIF